MRTYTRIDDQTAAAMSAELAAGIALSVIADKRGIHHSSASYAVKRWRKAHPGWEASAEYRLDSLRSRILDALATGQTFDTVGDIAKTVANGSQVGEHEVMHILYSLGRQHLVTFQEHRKGKHKDLTMIHQVKAVGTSPIITKTKHFDAAIAVEVVDEPVHETGPDSDTVAFAQQALVAAVDRYPLIESLTARASRLRQAAELLEAAGQDDLALKTLEKVDDLTPLEREVISFFAEKP